LVLNLALALVLLVVLLAGWAIRIDRRRPNQEFLPEMVGSVPFDAYAANPYFADGKTLQVPPAGTVRRGAARLEYSPDTSGAALAGLELESPYTLDSAAALAEGAYLYRDFCLPCHGAVGLGDGPVAARGYPPPPSLTTPAAMALPDGKMVHIVTFGRGNMPGYAAQIPLPDRWKALLQVRKLQRQATGTIAENPNAAERLTGLGGER
jgi:mono/diheme cytochrome c family protein